MNSTPTLIRAVLEFESKIYENLKVRDWYHVFPHEDFKTRNVLELKMGKAVISGVVATPATSNIILQTKSLTFFDQTG